MDLIARFLRSKLSPPAGLAWDLISGSQDMVGDPLQWGPNVVAAVKRGASAQEIADEIAKTQLFKMFVPMFAQDVFEAAQAEGLEGLGLGLTSFYGEGVNTYRTPEEAWAKTRRKAKLMGVDPAELLSATGTRRVGR
jgi:hypothetical protein